MEEKKAINMRVSDACTFCYLFAEDLSFHESFMELLNTEKAPSKVIMQLRKLSEGKHCYASKTIKKFYNTHKFVIDTIQQNVGGLQTFALYNYDYGYDKREVKFKSATFYKYLLSNVEKIDRILAVLERLKALGFQKFELNPSLDFSQEIYQTKVTFFENNRMFYLENMFAIPKYRHGVVTYKTSGSNYKIEFDGSSFSPIVSGKKIYLSSLTFDVDKLPKELSGQDIYNEIIELTIKKDQEYTHVRNSVDLSVGIQDLEHLLKSFNETVTKMETVDSKEQVLAHLRNMQQELNRIQSLSSAYNQSVTDGSRYITPELLQEEVKTYLKRREDEKIDWC